MNNTGSKENHVEDLSTMKAAMIKQLCDKNHQIQVMREKREKLRKKQKQTKDMLTTLHSLVPDMQHTADPDEESINRNTLEETHRALTASALKERQLLLEEYNKQYSNVSQLMSQSSDHATGDRMDKREEGRRADTYPYSETDDTPVHHLENISLTQPTPEREMNLEKYLRRHAHDNRRKSSPLSTAKQQLFSRDSVIPPGYSGAATTGLSGIAGQGRGEGADKSQLWMTERELSPGPPPLPGSDQLYRYKRYQSSSDMELTSLAGDGGVAYWEGSDIPVKQQLVGEDKHPYAEAEWQNEYVPVHQHSVPPPVPSETDKISKMWQFFQQQQQQRDQMTHSIYTNSVHQPHVPLATTPLQQQYTCCPTYYPPVQYCTTPHATTPQPFPLFSNSLPAAPYYPTAPAVQLSYPTPIPPAFYPSSVHANMYHSVPTPGPALHPTGQWMPEPRVPLTASCTQTDLTFSENPLSSQHRLSSAARDHLSRRELPPLPSHRQQQQQRKQQQQQQQQLVDEEADCSLLLPAAPGRRSAPIASTNTQKRFAPDLESPLFDQVREQIYSEVASLVSENESRPYYMLELLRVAQLLNTDYLRQSGLSSLKRVINNYLNPDQIDAQAFSAIPPPLPAAQVSERQVEEREETVYSPTQNFPLIRHYLNTNLSGSSENVDERSVSRAYQLTEAVDQFYSLVDNPRDFEAIAAVSDEDGSDISEITSRLSERDFEEGVSPWDQQVRTLVTRLIPFLKEHLNEYCEPRLLALIHQQTLYLLSELFPEEMVLLVRSMLDRDLKDILSRYTSQKLRDCGEELLVDMSDLFFSQMDFLTLSNSLQQASCESEGAEGSERDVRDQARDDALASATLNTPRQVETEDENVTDRTFTLSDSGLFIQGHKYIESDHPPIHPSSSPTLSPPRVNIINLTVSESRPMDEDATSEKSEDYSHSKTIDTISETASCTASDLSEVNPLPLKPVMNNSVPDSTLTSHPIPSLQDDCSSSSSDDLPPFATTCLSQGSFSLLPLHSMQQDYLCSQPSYESSNSEFIAEVLTLTSPEKLDTLGRPSPILVPSPD